VQEDLIQGYRVSPQQKRVWSIQQVSGGRPYWAECVMRINGTLDVAMLKVAWRETVEKHEILRTRFELSTEMDEPVQVIDEACELEIVEYALEGGTDSEQRAEVARVREDLKELAFSNQTGSSLRLALIRLEEKVHHLLIVLPVLCADKAGLENLARELSRRYEAALHGAELGDRPLQYADLAEWLNDLYESERGAISGDLWKNQPLPTFRRVKFPGECGAIANSEFAPAWESLALDPQITRKVWKLVERYDASPSAFFLACWQVLLWRLTGQSDVVVGIFCEGRSYPELRDVLGLFAGHRPLSIRLDENSNFSSLLRRVSELIRDTVEGRQSCPWSDIAEAAEGDNLFIPVGFEFGVQPQGYNAGELSFSIEESRACIDRIAIKLNCVQTRDAIIAEIHYDPELYPADDIRRLMGHYQALIGSGLSSPESVLSELDYLGESQRRQLLVEFNDTCTPHSDVRCVHRLFEEQVARRPDSMAVFFEECHLTYGELNRRANQVAHRLRRLGVGPDELVALYLDRSLEAIVGLLGILKAGGAYLPLDPVFPKDRIASMLSDARPLAVISLESLACGIQQEEIQLILLDAEWERIAYESPQNPSTAVTAENLVYAIYTSGSTGRPKAVGVEHRNLVNYVFGILERLGLPDGAVYATVTTLAADLGNTSIFPSLCGGGCLHVISADRATDPEGLTRYLRRRWIDCLKIVPSHMASLVADRRLDQALPCERLTLGGEACRWDTLDRLRDPKLAPRVFNHYGPTETTVGALTHEVKAEGPDHLSIVLPLSRPIANTQVYLLSSDLSPVPIYLPGQAHIGGASVARCYLKRPEATAEKFIPNPFSDESGSRLYRTGDLARFISDGSIEFLGRIDRQVKISGFRVELGEVEAALRSYPSVREVEVMAVDDKFGEKRLAAFLVARNGFRPTVKALRDFLKEKLPESTIPSAFVYLEELPLTPNGKLDRQALLKTRIVQSEEEVSTDGRSGMIQSILEGIWGELLGLDRVGFNENFFELGGHSLLAMRLCSRVKKAFSIELSLRQLFEAPTINGLVGVIEFALHSNLNKKSFPMRRVPRDQALPLSFAQQRLWFLEQLEPDKAAYNIPIALRLSGNINTFALEQCFRAVAARHEVLRTIFEISDGQPIQVIREDVTLTPPTVALDGLNRQLRDSVAARLAALEARGPFDLSRGPLLRVRLLRGDGDDRILLLTIHHIVFDAWSKDLLIREITALYSAFQTGNPSPLPDLPIQYADFASRQRQLLQAEYLNSLTSYWRGRLTPLPPRLDLPVYSGCLGRRSFEVAFQSVTLSTAVTNNLAALGRRQKVTLFMVMLAALKVILYRYTGEVDIAVGTPISSRDQTELETLIGFFLNTLALRTDLAGDPSFCELLARVRETALGAYAHQDLPFEKLVEELQPERDSKTTPIFQVMFIYDVGTNQGALKQPGLNLSELEFNTRPARYELTVAVAKKEGELTVSTEYDTGLYHPTMIAALLKHLRTLLGELAVNPDHRISTLPILSEKEMRQVTVEWNDTQRAFSEDASVTELIEIQAERKSDSIAVVFEEEQVSYGALNRRANRLANYLKSLGVRPEVKVGVCLERSSAALVGWLSVLKAGGAYIPLDPAYPADRLAFILNDTRASILLTQDSLVARLPKGEIRAIRLDIDWGGIARQNENNLPSEVTSNNVAYVIYTSGSTGTPKGVEIPQRAVVNFLESMYSRLGLGGDEVLFSVTSFSFDIAALELLLPLISGGRVVIASRGALSSGAGLSRWLADSTASIMQGTPTTWQMLLDSDWPGDRNLKILCGGEPLPPELASRLLERGARVWNLYGPTETTIWSTGLTLVASPGPVSIGKPIANTEVYLLDAHMNPTPIGVRGELYIGGVGLARGYHNRPELTAEKFIADPVGCDPGGRLYRTGDFARYRADGNIEFLGRSDGQVKIRGFRVELGEIEAVIGRHPNVKQNVVLVREDQTGCKRIVAYIVPAQGAVPGAGELRRYLAANLPEYMIPSTVLTLDKFPLTPNAKVDRRALPAPDGSRPLLEEQYVEPRTPTEQILTSMFSELLGVERVGLYDNFFDLGGHSLLVLKVLSRVRERFQVELSLQTFFESPRAAELADLLNQQGKVNSRSITPRDKSSNLAPLSFSQERIWFFEQLEPGTPTYNFPTATSIDGALNAGALEQGLMEVLRRQEALRTRIRVIDGRPAQVISPDSYQALSVVDLRYLTETQRGVVARRLVEEDARRPFELLRHPLLRVTWVRLEEGEQLLLLNMHHLISDVGSMNIVFGEIRGVYTSYSEGAPSPYPELAVQYADFAVWQREWLRQEAHEAQLSYWKKQLSGDIPMSTFPADYPRSAIQTFNGATQRFELPTAQTWLLKALSRREDVTLFMTLFAAFVTLLYRYTGRTDIAIGTPASIRDRVEIEGVIGCFINTLVLRVSLNESMTFRELLGRIRELTINAYAHQHLPFEYLVKALRLERSLAHQPLFQLLFRVDNSHRPADASGAPWKRLNVYNGAAKFDMEWAVGAAEGSLSLFLNYNVDLYHAATVTRLGEQYMKLLANLSAQSDSRLLEIVFDDANEAVRGTASHRNQNKDKFIFESSK
jgi:amino acid adenylation domain-containing protein